MTSRERISACWPHLTLSGVMQVARVSFKQVVLWCEWHGKVFDVKEVHKSPREYWDLLEKYLTE